MSQSAYFAHRLFLPAFMTSLLMGCGGGSSPASVTPTPPPVANTSVTLLASGTANDRVVQASFTLNSLTLMNAAGKAVSVLSTPQRVEFVHLNGTVESLVTVAVPQDRYTSASAALGNSGFGCVVLGQTGGIDAGSYSTVAATPTVTLSEPLVVGGTPMALVLNLVVSPLQAAAACDGLSADQPPSPIETITPAFDLSGYATAGQAETNLIGVITAITMNGSGFSVTGTDGPVWSVATNDNTVFQGVTGFSKLAAGMPLNFDAALQPDGSLLASRVEVTDTNITDLTIMRGPSIFLSAAEPEMGLFITESTGALFAGAQALGPWSFGFGADTLFKVSAQMSNLSSLPFSPGFNGSNMVAGQSVYMSTHAANFPDAPDLVAATTVTLVPQTIDGTVTEVSSAGSFTTYTVALASYATFAALAQQPGQTTILANPGSVVVYVDGNTRTLNTAPLAVGSLLRFGGLVFNDNGTLRMDCAEVWDGVAL
jgi:Domain of unknown function (DUF5666)